ncbi:glycosyltransferase family 4 protein [Bacillus sp. CGMCC 1.16607]|uniref:glycosyltransferase family 4 protein n=1 Tax=Bacillus sp. CGMCC 1.16607 TaxID=3351842 RepID=UPI003627FC29
MKILHFISGGETGGSRKHVITLLSQFPKGQVTLAVLQEGALSEEAKEAGIDVKVFKQSSRYDLSVLNQLVRFIRENHFDILHTHGPRANLFGVYIKSKVNIQWVTTVHSDPKLDFMKSGIKGKVFTKLNLFAINRMDYFFAVSETFKRNLVSIGIAANKIKTVYNGIHFSTEKANPISRDALQVEETDFVMTMVARLHPIKGHELVFQALKQLNLPDVKLLLVGDGPIKDELLHKVKEVGVEAQVRFLGFRQDVDAIYTASDLALLASYSESFPLALLEAANQHIPLVTTDVGGVRELVTEGETGWIVPIGDALSLQAAFAEAYNQSKNGALKEMGTKLYQHASSHFSLDQLYKNTVETYEMLQNK